MAERMQKKMRIRILYDNKPTYLEVPDEDLTIMIDADYEERLSIAEDQETVARRSVQEIIDERFNKPEYNNWHKFDRHYGIPKKPFRKDEDSDDETDHMDFFPDNSDEKTWEKQAEYECVCDVIRKTLKPKHAEPLIAIYLDGIPVTEYAEREGVSKSAISHRLDTAKKNFKKVFPNSSTFTSSKG
jgi:DNA-directed RNA polymerase specialized sigma24 family protein